MLRTMSALMPTSVRSASPAQRLMASALVRAVWVMSSVVFDAVLPRVWLADAALLPTASVRAATLLSRTWLAAAADWLMVWVSAAALLPSASLLVAVVLSMAAPAAMALLVIMPLRLLALRSSVAVASAALR